MSSLLAVTSANRPYKPYGAAEDALYCRNNELLLSGPAGTGKSRGLLEKLHYCAEKYPEMRGLILRKTRASLTDSGLVTFEDKVLPEGHPALGRIKRENRHSYNYPNGSELVVGGLDKATRVMSTEYDMIYVQEAIELTEDDWENLTTRLRNGRIPYQQIIADTNPDKPIHWLKRRADSGRVHMMDSRHEDNPTLFNTGTQQWTAAGVVYIDRLDNLTGARYYRLRKGMWVSAEGLVYEGWDTAIHLIDRFEIPAEWKRYLAIDFGYTNPFVCQWWAVDPDGRLYMYREIYKTQTLVQDHAVQIEKFCKDEPRIIDITCDHDAEDRATLERHTGRGTTLAHKDVSPGIQAVQQRLKKAGDGKPRIFLLRDSVVERDPSLIEKKKPCCTAEEFDGYIWEKEKDGKTNKEEPVKVDDHGMDTLRYMVAKFDSVYRPKWEVG